MNNGVERLRLAEIIGFGFMIVMLAGIFSVVLMVLQFSFGMMGIDLSNVTTFVELYILVLVVMLGMYVLLVYAPSVIRGR